MKLIENANQFYKMWSVQLVSLIFALEVASQSWDKYSQFVPDPYHGYIQGALAIAAIVARMIRQSGLHNVKR